MEPIYITQEKFDEITTELNHLKTVVRPEIADRVQTARALGDLSENAEYHSARDDQGKNESRIQEIESILKVAQIVERSGGNTVEMGATVTVQKLDTQDKKEYQIVSPTEADMAQGKLSTESPLGEAMVGKKKGETFIFKTPKGEVTYKIISIK